MSTRLPFWSDDFDMDLLEVYPNVVEALGATADIPVWTVGHSTLGRLNHPSVWNSHGAFLWLEKPNLPRDEHGWLNIGGCVSNDAEIEATWLEFLRDWWAHSYGFVILGASTASIPGIYWKRFETLLYHRRKWRLDYEQAEQTSARESMAAHR